MNNASPGVEEVVSPHDQLVRIAKHWPPLAPGIPALTQLQAAQIVGLIEAADAVVLLIGAHGEIDSHHRAALDLLAALNVVRPSP